MGGYNECMHELKQDSTGIVGSQTGESIYIIIVIIQSFCRYIPFCIMYTEYTKFPLARAQDLECLRRSVNLFS